VLYVHLQRLRKEVDSLEKQLAAAKKQLETETIARVDLENRCQSLKEELAFNRQVHQQVRTGTLALMLYCENIGLLIGQLVLVSTLLLAIRY
jgi:uncharacterized protein YhaN